MYSSFNYNKIFEAEQTGTPITQDGMPASKKVKELVINLTDENLVQLNSAIESNSLFEIPVQKVSYTDNSIESAGTAYFMTFGPGTQVTPDNTSKLSELIKTPQNYLFLIEKTQDHALSSAKQLSGSETGAIATGVFTRYNTQDQIAITFVKSEPALDAEQTNSSSEPTPSQEILTSAMNTGELVGANPSNKSVMRFDDFVSEAKKDNWIAGVVQDMKKGGLRKEMGKKKGEKITPAEIKKSEAALKKKDKDKKKPGLQLNPKDAKTHKRNVLAKNLMKASGAMNESRQAKIKGAKDQLVKIHEVIEKMIKQTSKKSTK
jgi:hypothetical protein